MTITIDPIAAVVLALGIIALWDGLRRYADARGLKAQVRAMLDERTAAFDKRMADHGEAVKRTEVAMENLRDQFMAELVKFSNALGVSRRA